MKHAQDYFPNIGGSFGAGFNRKIAGYSYSDAFRYSSEHQDNDLHCGWNTAEKLIGEGKIYFTHNFHVGTPNKECFAFPYGGSMCCNSCGGNHLAQPWWNIKVFPDGAAWCCVGEGFINLQESSNVAFGDSREDAIIAYGRMFQGDSQ